MRSRRARRVLLAVAGLAVLLGLGSAVGATAAKPDFGISANPQSASVQRGNQAQFDIAISRFNGFGGAVSLAASGFPFGTSGTLTADATGHAAHRTLTVSTNVLASVGTHTLTITGASGKISHTAQVKLTITAPAPPSFTLAVTPTSAQIVQGSSTVFIVSVARTNLSTPIDFTVTGVPSHATATFSPTSTTGTATALTVQTASNTPAGSYLLLVKGKAGTSGPSSSVTATLTVTAPPPPSFTLAVASDNINVSAGLSGAFTVTITRTNLSAPIGFTLTGAPSHTTASFSPTPTSGNTTTLTVQTASNTPLGSYSLVVKGAAGSVVATVIAHLTVSAAHAQSFPITGSLDRTLAPGVTGYLNLAMTNSNNQPLSVTSLSVSISGTNKPACTTSNFAVTQFSAAYPITVPANSTKTLSQLGIPQSAWPKVKMIDLPVNQDACKSTGLTLTYTGAGQGN
jgi:hypothetical protein